MAQQDQRATSLALVGAQAVDGGGQVAQQAVVGGNVAARSAGGAVAALVVAGGMPAPVVQAPGDGLVAPDVLAQAVDDQHGAAGGQRQVGAPFPPVQREAVMAGQSLHGAGV